MLAAPVGAAQTVRASLDVPKRRHSFASKLSCVSNPFDPPYEYGRMEAPPESALARLMRSAICSSASSHEIRLNLPSPLRPFRIAGYRRRSGPYRRSPNFRTFAQMNPSVTGFLCDPSISITRPRWTVTVKLHASGQSSGHAVSTAEDGPPRTGSPRLSRADMD